MTCLNTNQVLPQQGGKRDAYPYRLRKLKVILGLMGLVWGLIFQLNTPPTVLQRGRENLLKSEG